MKRLTPLVWGWRGQSSWRSEFMEGCWLCGAVERWYSIAPDLRVVMAANTSPFPHSLMCSKQLSTNIKYGLEWFPNVSSVFGSPIAQHGLRMGKHGRSWEQEAECSSGGARRWDSRGKRVGMGGRRQVGMLVGMQVGTLETFDPGWDHYVHIVLLTKQKTYSQRSDLDIGWDVEETLVIWELTLFGGVSSVNKKWGQEWIL